MVSAVNGTNDWNFIGMCVKNFEEALWISSVAEDARAVFVSEGYFEGGYVHANGGFRPVLEGVTVSAADVDYVVVFYFC